MEVVHLCLVEKEIVTGNTSKTILRINTTENTLASVDVASSL